MRYPEATDGREAEYPKWYRDAFHLYAWESAELDSVRGQLAAQGAHVTYVTPDAIGLATDEVDLPKHAKGTWRTLSAAHPFVASFLERVGGKVTGVRTVRQANASNAALGCAYHGEACTVLTCPLRGLISHDVCACFERYRKEKRSDAKRTQSDGHHVTCELYKRAKPGAPAPAPMSTAQKKRVASSLRSASKDRKQRAKAARQMDQLRLL